MGFSIEKIGTDKTILRKVVREKVNKFSDNELHVFSNTIWEKVENLNEFVNANIIAIYWSLKSEVSTQEFINIWYKKKIILLPCIDENELRFKKFSDDKKMGLNPGFGVKEPTGKVAGDYENIDLIIVPGVAFDKNNNRLGRGKGFYDRFLKKTNAYKLGVCFPFQLFENIPVTDNDVKMDQVITA